MEKKRKWQFICILVVAALTIYNILPTVLYYTKPLHSPVHASKANEIIQEINHRLTGLEQESQDWLSAFCDHLHLHPSKISQTGQQTSFLFEKEAVARKFQAYLSEAGAQIPFAPLKISTIPSKNPNEVIAQRHFSIHPSNSSDLFSYISKDSSSFREWTIDRAAQIAAILGQKKQVEEVEAVLRQDGKYLFENGCLFAELQIRSEEGKLLLKPRKSMKGSSKADTVSIHRLLAQIQAATNESFAPCSEGFEIALHQVPDFSGMIALDLEKLADLQIDQLISQLKNHWHPDHPDLQNIPIVDAKTYATLDPSQKSLCLIVYSPLLEKHLGNKYQSLFLVMKGLDRIAKGYQDVPDSSIAQVFQADLTALSQLLQRAGYTRSSMEADSIPFSGDVILEIENFAHPFLEATREDFRIRGSQRMAVLELGTFQQRMRVENKIDTTIHNELIAWVDAYNAAQVSPSARDHYLTPKPKRSIFLSNFLLSLKKIFRGDDRKIIQWGLDLSGGKTVEVELRDAEGRLVDSDAEIRQGINELSKRINKMGLSEVSIRQAGNRITIDFPGSQSFSAAELIQASTMQFHVINERFSPYSPNLGVAINQFLQKVWDEARFANTTDLASIQKLAEKILETDLSEETKRLKESGLQFHGENKSTLSKIAMWRGSNSSDWHGQSHPLLVVFQEHALEGAHLKEIHSSYDVQKGNYLHFSVASSAQGRDGIILNPQNQLQKWTSLYCREGIFGTPNELLSRSRGWRMAVVLNDTVISAPVLDSAIKDSASISGNFSQTEVQKLAADLKAGSLTYTPHILSEKNVSPELGTKDRSKGIAAAILAFFAVIFTMVAYYRFAGWVASMAVLFNLFILWATLQNLGATLTLSGIAGIILTIGMAVDANVLVFERIKEEFALTGNIKSAIQAGYSKAFSAIVDSNITTIIAAFILLHFDAGPIKSFAMNLIIGIISSMFTALFVTRFYFSGWVKKTKAKALHMSHWFSSTAYDFLKYTRVSFGVATLLITTGFYALFMGGSSPVLGLDFTGGFSLNLELAPTNQASQVENALFEKGLTRADFSLREMNPSHSLRILFSQGMEQKGKPFHGLAFEPHQTGAPSYLFETNPKLVWVVQTLAESGIALPQETLQHLHTNWSSISGQMSDTMRTNAILGCALALVAIFIYLAFRFESKFAAAALVCLIHDLLATIAMIGLFHFLKVPVQIDLITIAAIMTTIGYSLNDTIIVFDRVREEMGHQAQSNLKAVVNRALNSTLSRTLITSGTTLVVLIVLLLIGGPSIFGFSLVMTIGVVIGTISSWFIAAPLVLYFHRRQELDIKVASRT